MASHQRAYTVLAKREAARASYSAATHPGPPAELPAELFYSRQRSRQNHALNRYSNIYAYDRTAVRGPGVDYLNANVVLDGKGGWWVATQAPTPHTFKSFFNSIEGRFASSHPLVHEDSKSNSAIIVQLTGWEENGMIKADRYFSSGSPYATVKRTSRHVDLSSDLTELLVGDMSVYHYHFDAWPDHGVPTGEAVQSLVRLVHEVEAKRQELGCEVWVHCSAGIGRSGTFIALSSLLHHNSLSAAIPDISPLGPLPKELRQDRVACCIDTIRECRWGLVQNADQLALIYDIVESPEGRD